jgi:hypothetical protein
MPETSVNKPMTTNNDGVTQRYAGFMQWPMTREDQKRSGLIAITSRSISGRQVKTQGESA